MGLYRFQYFLFVTTFMPFIKSASSETPTFLIEPTDMYVMHDLAVVLRCSAKNVIIIKWICENDNVDMKPRLAKIDRSVISSNLTLKFTSKNTDHVACKCKGESSDNQFIFSKKAKVARAYIKDHFAQWPLSQRTELGKTATFYCKPPKAYPDAIVSWEKDGKPIDLTDSAIIIMPTSGLHISKVKQSHKGNYTCIARNVVGQRKSNSAELIIAINGQWSEWSSFSQCSSPCGRATRERKRKCNNPRPSNGGNFCVGKSIDTEICTTPCVVDGGWSDWESWAVCSPSCVQHRSRSCNNPKPLNGRDCSGGVLEAQNCTGGYCKKDYTGVKTNNKHTVIYNQILLTCLFLIIFLAIISALALLFICYKKRYLPTVYNEGFGCTMSGYLPNMGIMKQNSESSVVTQFVNGQGVVASCRKDGQYYKALFVDTQKQPVPANQYISDSDNHTSNYSASPMKEPPSPDHYSYPMDVYEHLDSDPGYPVEFPTNVIPNYSLEELRNQLGVRASCLAVGKVGYSGGRLCLPESGISLLIPEGAVPRSLTYELYLAVSREDACKPLVGTGQTILSPIVLCGPRDLTFLKPVAVTFRHCAHEALSDWTIALQGSDNTTPTATTWKSLTTLSHDSVSSSIYCQLNDSKCSALVDQLSSGYCLVGQSNTCQQASKELCLACFAPLTRPISGSLSLRVYCIDNSTDALEHVLDVEESLGGILVQSPKKMLYCDSNQNLCLTIDNVDQDWKSMQASNYQEIPFSHVWNGSQGTLHATFAVEPANSKSPSNSISLRIHIFQASAPAEYQTIQLNAKLDQPIKPATIPIEFDMSDGSVSVFRIPSTTRCLLQQLLDPPNSNGNDWRMLARKLKFDRHLQYFATRQSPSESIFNLWEARNRDANSVRDLAQIFRNMGRTDCALLVQQEASYYSGSQ